MRAHGIPNRNTDRKVECSPLRSQDSGTEDYQGHPALFRGMARQGSGQGDLPIDTGVNRTWLFWRKLSCVEWERSAP